MTYAIHLCGDHRTPPGDKECLAAIWSQGRSCRKCYVDCYRNGWEKWRVDADNKERVAAKNKGKGG